MASPDSTPNGDPIMVARFAVPVLPATFVRRPRLEQRLDEGLRGPLVVVSGPAGAGKTLLAAHCFRALDGRDAAAWLTVEQSDNAPGVFWAYVVEALRHHGVPLPDAVRAPADAERVDPALLSRLAAHLHGLQRPAVLVLDEFDRITSPAIAAGLHELLRHAGPGLRLVLVSRSEPLLPLHRYRAADELACVRAADLAFSPDEAVELFGLHGLAVSPASILAINDHMGGWAVGLRFAALAAREAPDAEAFLREFETGHGTVADFLTDEVFRVQPAETRDLLLRTCVLDQIHPDLADALTGRLDGAKILADLHRANAFVSPIGHGWYRHHPLFAEILRIRLRVIQPGLDRQLHARAARWLGAHGQVVAALPHAAEAGEWALAADLLVRSLTIGRLLAGRDTARLAALFAAMPPETAGPAPELVRACLALCRHDPDRAVEHLGRAQRATPEDDDLPRFIGACLSVLAARLHGCAELARAAADEAADLRARLPRELVDAHPELAAHLMGDLGAALLWDGRFAEAGRALAAAAEAPEAPGTAQPRHDSLSGLGLIDVLDGRLALAEAHARAAVADAERSGLPSGAGAGGVHLVLAEVALDRGELDTADAELRHADVAADDHQDPMVTQALGVTRSRLLLARGEPDAALDALREAGKAAPAAASPWLADRTAATVSAALLAAGRPDAAIAALSDTDGQATESALASAFARLALGDPATALRALDDSEPNSARTSVVYVQVLLARAQAVAALGDPAAARRLVQRALATAGGERLRLPFRLATPWLRRTLRGDPALARPYPWLPVDLRAAGVSPAPDAPSVEPLSEREREVLECAAELLSTEEIAADLFISVNTVKTHLKNINRKLAANHRGEAVRRARQLNLL
jgi:LuxR family maltose regulon positive regulatory protein